MLWFDVNRYCNGVLVLMVIVTACAMFAYYVNSKRPDDDPKKKSYHPLAILFAPITFPFLAVLSVSFFLLRVLAYGIFMVLFIFALVFVRKPFIIQALQKRATGIGDRLLEANTLIIRFFLSPWINSSKS